MMTNLQTMFLLKMNSPLDTLLLRGATEWQISKWCFFKSEVVTVGRKVSGVTGETLRLCGRYPCRQGLGQGTHPLQSIS